MNADRIDWIYNTVDDLLLAGKFAEVDTMLRDVDLETLGIAEMLSYLTITLYATEKLHDRAAFYDRVRARLLVVDPSRADGLLRGLSSPSGSIAPPSILPGEPSR